MATGRGANGPSKKDRREEAREHARLMREEAKKKARRRKWIIQGSIGVAIIAVLAIVALVIVNTIPQGQTSAGPKNMISNGIVLTSTTKAVRTPALQPGATPVATAQPDKATKAYITVYLDYQCPYCQEFEATNATQIGQWLNAGLAQLEIHPLAMLDASSNGTKYSSRAMNAAACVANYDPDDYFAVNTALFKDQPAENTSGLTDAKILSILKGAGASSSQITSCVNNDKFSSWVTASTTRSLTKPLANSSVPKVSGTPTVIVNGKQYNGSLTDADTFAAFVETTVGASSTSTPTPTPTATQ